MTNINRGLWLAAAGAVLAFAAGCGGGEIPDGGTGACTTDATCGAGKGCHPVLKTCVATCTGATDCPSDQKTCAKINNSAASFCTCSTDALCAASNTGFICNAATQQCSAKCTSNASCPSGFTCNTTSGQCAAGGTDAGTDAGMTGDAGTLCNNASQPDVCGYGNVCNGNTPATCDPIDNGTCSNVTSGAGATNHSGWTSASTGPVIYLITDEAVDDQTKCANFPDGGVPTPFTVTVYAYAGTSPATFPAQKSNLPGFFYYTTGGTANDIPVNFLQQSNYTLYDNDRVMGAKFTLCGATGLSMINAGFGFTNGNGACAQLTH
jgi:hypothetical protein